MKRTKGFWSGFLACALLMSMIGTAFAAYTRQETLHFNGIKLMLDGELVSITDSTGAATEPFIINGTTYLPVSSVAKLLGMGVEWDGASQTVKLKTGRNTDNPQTPGLVDGSKTSAGAVLMDERGIKVTYLGIEKIEYMIDTYYINLKIENNSDVDYTVQTREEIINDIVTHNTTMSEDIPAGKVAYSAIHAMALGKDGIIEPLEKIEFYFHVVTPKTWESVFDTNTITIYP